MNPNKFPIKQYRAMLVKQRQRRLKNVDFTLISNNCCGGIIYHDLGLRFSSPTINVGMNIDDYFTYLENLSDFFQVPVTHDDTPASYALGKLELSNGKKVYLHFQHDKVLDEPARKFDERARRAHLNNLYIFMEAGIETTDEIVYRFAQLPFEHKVIITNRPYPDVPCALCLDVYGEGWSWGQLLRRIPGTCGAKRWLELFDYISWLNTGDIHHAKHYQKYIQRFSHQ